MTGIEYEKMREIVLNFKNKKVLVLGDIMLDKYIWGNVARISPEAPVPVVEVNNDTSCLGGAGNVASSLEKLGALPLLVGVVGNDPESEWIKKNVPNSRGIFVDKNRPTTVKTRIIAHHQPQDDTREFPYVSRPVIGLEKFQQVRTQRKIV